MRPHTFSGLASSVIRGSNQSAFTRAELMATVAGVFLCAAIILPSLANTGNRSEQIGCLNNLRQIGIAFQAWGNDHNDQRPWTVFAENGGGEFSADAFFQFCALSNYMSPTLLIDPGERVQSKRVARNWSASPLGGILSPNFQDNALSYMLGPHATIAEAANILTADRDVVFDGLAACSYGFAPIYGINWVPSPSLFRGWTNGNHGSFGNVLLNDGRVEYTSSQRLHSILFRENAGANPGHFLVPSD